MRALFVRDTDRNNESGMRTIMTKRSLCTVVVVIAALCAITDAQAQPRQARNLRRVPVTVAFVDSLPVPGTSFVVRRRPTETPSDVILLRPDAGAGELSDAIRTLLTARQAGGDFPITAATVRMRPHQRVPGQRPAFPWGQRVLHDMARAAPRPVAGVGTVRAVEIFLPSQRRGSGH
jgi:hypothetical protein